ncbi:MAG: hypothetical protein Q9O74_11575 [Planctomycetota bacterium]|nr:hypothetical protein [Planctomycetota bacterium]
MRLSRARSARGLSAELLACLAQSTTGCATDWNTRQRPTLCDIGGGVLAVRAIVGGAFGFAPPQDAGGGTGSRRNHSFGNEQQWERTGE